MKSIKKSFFIGAAIIVLAAPDLAWEYASHLLHMLYEALSFLLEEVLIHGLGFTKHRAQMLVFYTLLFFLCGLIGYLWRRWPFLVETAKAHLVSLLFRARDHAMEIWLAMSAVQKLKLLTANVIGLWLAISLLLM